MCLLYYSFRELGGGAAATTTPAGGWPLVWFDYGTEELEEKLEELEEKKEQLLVKVEKERFKVELLENPSDRIIKRLNQLLTRLEKMDEMIAVLKLRIEEEVKRESEATQVLGLNASLKINRGYREQQETEELDLIFMISDL
mgnify:CR=1 FL=1